MFEKRPDWARAGRPFDGKRYGLNCTWEGDGEAFSYDEDRVILEFKNRPTVRSQVYGIIRLPEFVVGNSNNSEEWRIQRSRRLPPQIFEIKTGDQCIGQIIQRGLFCTRYEINLANGIKWNLSLPLFTNGFFGSSSDGGRLLFWFNNHRLWQAVVDPDHVSIPLIASLAFLHRERLRQG
jgi:hypothetical protein